MKGLLLALFAAATIVGCKTAPARAPKAEIESSPAVAARIPATSLRQTYQSRPDVAAVGLVSAVLPEQPYLAVGDLPVQDIKPGDVFTFMSADGMITGNGTVEQVKTDSVHVRFEPEGSHRPGAGDLAIKFKR